VIIFYSPQNTPPRRGRLPMSLLALGAVVEGKAEYVIVDGNVDRNALSTIRGLCRSGRRVELLAVSVMPGTQMLNAVAHCRSLREEFPALTILWGGYFASMHTDSVLNSTSVSYVLTAQAERAFPEFLEFHRGERTIDTVHNLVYRRAGSLHRNAEHPIFDPNDRPLFPYDRLNLDQYALPTFIGKRTLCHETSVGCPHKCNFCGVVDVFKSRWKAETPERTIEVLQHLIARAGMDGVEFHDSDFFVSQARVAELAERMSALRLEWWGEGRIDTLLTYDTPLWKAMRRSGLRMIFFGAESGSDEMLQLMEKGGVTVEKTKEIAARCAEHGIRPEFSFVMGAHPTKTGEEIDATIGLMYELQRINPSARMHPFIYTPAPFGSIYEQAADGGLRYPATLEEWAWTEWAQYSLRQNPHTPWLTRKMTRKIVNFRAVYQSYFPTLNDLPISPWKVRILRFFSAWRYKASFFAGALELRLLLRLLLKRSQAEGGF